MEKFSSSAKVIDGTLILTLPDAVTPVVWQMQLGQTKSSALEVREQNDGTWLLVLKTPRMDVMSIAPFATKDRAVRALLAVSRAMEKAHGQIGPYAGNASYPVPAVIPSCTRGGILCRILKWIFRAAVIVIAMFLLLVIFLWATRSGSTPATSTAAVTQQAAPPVAGAPMSADDFLNNQ